MNIRNIASTLSRKYFERQLRREREFNRRILLFQNERNLRDCGFSPELLREGVDAWPWRLDDNPGLEKSSVEREVNNVEKLHITHNLARLDQHSASRTNDSNLNREETDFEKEHSDAA